jgi:hypothetical protein
VRDVLAFEADRAARRVDEAQDRFAGRRLSAAALADEPERLAGASGKTRRRPPAPVPISRDNKPPRTG